MFYRFGVLSNQDRLLVKDMYLVPLLETQPVPDGLLKLCKDDVSHIFSDNRPSMLVGIVVRHKTGSSTDKRTFKSTKEKSRKRSKSKGI